MLINRFKAHITCTIVLGRGCNICRQVSRFITSNLQPLWRFLVSARDYLKQTFISAQDYLIIHKEYVKQIFLYAIWLEFILFTFYVWLIHIQIEYVQIGIIISVSVLTYLTSKYINREFAEIVFASGVCCILITIGLSSLSSAQMHASELNNMNFGSYNFYVYTNSDNFTDFTNFSLTLDYEKNTGNIKFSLGKGQVQNLYVEVPTEYNITSVELSQWQNLTEGKNYDTSRPLNNSVDITNFRNLNERATGVDFLIHFDAISPTTPNGKFSLDFVYPVRVYTHDFTNKIIFIKTGQHFSCKGYCFANTKDAELNIENGIVSAAYPDNYFWNRVNNTGISIPLRMEFSINIQDNDKAQSVDRENQMAIGLLLAGIVGWFTLLTKIVMFPIIPRQRL